MKRLSLSSAFATAVLTVVAVAGCQKPASTTGATATPTTSGSPTPEESFATIVETFRRGVEDVPIGFVVHDSSGGQTMMTGRNEVTHELFPPAKAGDPFKAVIKVKSESRYSLQRTKEDADADDSSQESDQDSGDASGDSDVQIFDPSVASAGDAKANESRKTAGQVDKNAVTVAPPVEDTHEGRYELIYENGRWKLVTKLNPKTEGSIQFAFDRALESQS